MNKFLVILATCTLCGCEWIYPEDWERAVLQCKNNGGLKHLYMMGDAYNSVCNNGAKFENFGSAKEDE